MPRTPEAPSPVSASPLTRPLSLAGSAAAFVAVGLIALPAPALAEPREEANGADRNEIAADPESLPAGPGAADTTAAAPDAVGIDPGAAYPRQAELPEPPEDPDDASVKLDLIPYHGIAPALNELQETSDRVSVEVIGESLQGRDLYLVTLTEPETRAEARHQQRMRELIAEKGFTPDAQGIRACRAAVRNDPSLVQIARKNAQAAGVADKAQFVQGDMFEADISRATVLALFLLTENLNRLAPKFLELKPGSRIVVNGYRIDRWDPDETGRARGDCGGWCTAYLYIVPAKVAGTWRTAQGELTLQQDYQKLSGVLSSGGTRMPGCSATSTESPRTCIENPTRP